MERTDGKCQKKIEHSEMQDYRIENIATFQEVQPRDHAHKMTTSKSLKKLNTTRSLSQD